MQKFTLLFVLLVAATDFSFGQCTALANATAGPTLACVGGTSFRSGVAYNPDFDILYSVNSGSANYSIETFDPAGNPLNSTTQGFDFRGLWWNPLLSSLEGNGFSSLGIFVENLNVADGYPLGTGTVIFPGMNQPATHSCGQFDPVNNHIIYYSSGAIHRYDRNTASFVSSTTITGLPVSTSNLNSTSIAYTGCAGMEVGVYDYVNRRVYLIDLASGAYVATSQLPANAPTPTNQRMSYANDLFWVFDVSNLTWKSYQILANCPVTTSNFLVTECESFTSPSGNYTWTTSGVYTDTIPNAAGCDSVLTFDLTINYSAADTISPVACDRYTVPSGLNTYTISGTYTDLLSTTAGCDSLLTINLTIETLDAQIAQDVDTLMASPAGAVSYQWLDCGNGYAVINGATDAHFTISASRRLRCCNHAKCLCGYFCMLQCNCQWSG